MADKKTKRLNIEGLIPNEEYVIQVRAVDAGENSPWSERYKVTTIDDTTSDAGPPKRPTITSFLVNAAGQYDLDWTCDRTYADGSAMVVFNYEIELSASPGGTPMVAILPHYGNNTSNQSRTFSFALLRANFGGQLPSPLTARVRVVSSGRTPSDWSEPFSATLPIPNPPTNPQAEGVVDGIRVWWEPPTDPIHLYGYRVYISRSDPNFVPDVALRTNLIYEGPSLETAYTSLAYDKMHYFKIVSYSIAGFESTWVTAQAMPISPYGPDEDPPTVPTLNSTVTMNSTRTSATLTWQHDKTLPANKDTAGFVIAWKATNETLWRNSYFDTTETSAGNFAGIIDIPRPYANYEFKIAAYDFVGNYSAYSSVSTLSGTVAPPLAPTNLQAAAGLDNLRITWDASESDSVKNGGYYQVQFRATNSFPSDTPIDYTVGDPFLQVSGLTVNSPYWFRVRAVDSAGQTGTWSTVATKSTNNFPVDPTSDGQAPSTAPANPKATGGLNYVNVSWNTVVNDDATWYEVHISTTNGFTPNGSTKVAEAWGTSAMVNTDASGALLNQGTVYYFKVVARDADGLGPYSSQASAQLTQVASAELGINMSGENLLFNSSFETDSDGNGMADYWQVVNNSSGTNPTTASLVPGRVAGVAQRVSWTGVNGGNIKGIKSLGAGQLRPGTEYIYSFYARAGTGASTNAGTGFNLTLSPAAVTNVAVTNPTPSATTWQRYVFRIVTNSTVDLDNGTISVVGHSANGGWIEIDDAQLESGNLASAYKPGTVSIAKLTTGAFTSADMIISTGGTIRSKEYVDSGGANGYLISSNNFVMKSGQVDAKTLVADSTISNNLFINNVLQMAANGVIRSADWVSSAGTSGYSLTNNSLVIRNGTIAASTLIGGTISSPDIKVGLGGKITIDQNGSIVSNNYTDGVSGWKIGWNATTSTTGIEMWDVNSKINVNALVSSTLTTSTLKIGSGGSIESENWSAPPSTNQNSGQTNPGAWRINSQGFSMINGQITGAAINTNQLNSLDSESVGGVTRKKFSINTNGYAEFSGLMIYGNARLGSSASHVVESGNFDDTAKTGWRIDGAGAAWFNNVATNGMTISGNAVVSGSSAHSIRSGNWEAAAAGWIIRGDGTAEFNNGSFRIGSYTGGAVWGRVDDAGRGQFRFYRPGYSGDATDKFSSISQTDNTFDIRGANGGLVSLRDTWFTGRKHVVISQDAYVTGEIRVDNGITTEMGGLNVKAGGIGVNGGIDVRTGGMGVNGADFVSATNNTTLRNNVWLPNLSTPNGGGKREVLIDSNNLLIGGQTRGSTIRIKKDIVDFKYTKEQVLSLRPVNYKLKEEFWYDDSANDNSFGGVIAEEAQEAGLHDFVILGTDGLPEDFDYQRFTSGLLHVAREQQKEIDELRSIVDKLVKALDK